MSEINGQIIEIKGMRCPHCGSANIETYPFPEWSVDQRKQIIVSLVHCKDCKGKDWELFPKSGLVS